MVVDIVYNTLVHIASSKQNQTFDPTLESIKLVFLLTISMDMALKKNYLSSSL